MSDELKQLAKEYDDAPDDAEWEPPHPIFRMALENDIFKEQNAKLQAQNAQLVKALKHADEAMMWDLNGEPLPSLMMASRADIKSLLSDIEKGNVG